MTLDLTTLDHAPRLLFALPLAPLQGQRFQPTGFPGLGAATFRAPSGDCLLVESAQSMANRLELTLWDDAASDVIEAVKGISHVRIEHNGKFLSDTILEAHRLNSPYLLEPPGNPFLKKLEEELGGLAIGPVDRKRLAQVLLKYDIGSLLHGVFLAKKNLAGGRLRVARALSAFIEADGVRIAPSGGVKNDHVNPKGDAKAGFGNVPFARDEFTAERITLYVNLDLAQIRGYALGRQAERLLVLLALYKLRRLIDGNLRLRTACDLACTAQTPTATSPTGFVMPALAAIEPALKAAIADCATLMQPDSATFKGEFKSAADDDDKSNEQAGPDGDEE